MDDRRISAKSIAEQLDISRERVGPIIHEDFNIRKLSAQWVSKCPNASQKCQGCQPSEQLLECFRCDPNDFLPRLVTMDETWLYYYYPETQQQSMEWRHSGSPRPKKSRVQKSAGKCLATILWDEDGILKFDYLPKGQTINAEYYLSLLVQLKDILTESRRAKSPKESWPCSGTTMPHLTEHLQPRRNWPTWASSILIIHPILRIWPHRTTICSLD